MTRPPFRARLATVLSAAVLLALLLSAAAALKGAVEERPYNELAAARYKAAETRKTAAAHPTITHPASAPVRAYLAEQQRRRLLHLTGLRERLEQYQGDPSKAALAGVLKQQLAELESKPPREVDFDSDCGYPPETGLVGYARRVRFLENTADENAVILVDSAALVIGGLDTGTYASGKFFGIDRAILVGAPRADYVFRGSPKKCYNATLVDLESLLKSARPLVVDLWPGKPADDAGIPGKEHFFELVLDGKPHQIAGRPTIWLKNVTRPTLTIYRPAADKNTSASMLICPGGGYHKLGWDVEGEEIAAWLNSIGVTGIILKYRCPRREGDVKNAPPDGPLKDAQRAVSLVRSRAAEWGLDPHKIGMVGFSAGGHLVGATATRFEQRTYAPIDAVDEVSCRPDFGVMCYSGYFKLNEQGDLSPTVRAISTAPPLLFVHAADDPISSVEHSITFFVALKRAGAERTEMHVYSEGGHGFGVRDVGLPCATWTDRCVDWLRSEGILPPPASSKSISESQ